MIKKDFPTAQTILIVISAFVAILTWIIPAGNFNTLIYDTKEDTFIQQGNEQNTQLPASQETLNELNIEIPLEKFTSGDIYKPISIPGTYHQLDPDPQGFFAFVQAPIRGIIASADIIFLVLFIGGLIGIMNLTGAFDAGIAWLGNALEGREFLLIIFTTLLIALGGTTFGMAEETLAFYPILIPVFMAAKYDAMVGLACIYLGSSVGTMCSTTNPFSTIIASDAAGINWTTGLYGRLLMLVLCLGITIAYILQYARKIKKDPSQSLLYAQREQMKNLFRKDGDAQAPQLDNRLRLILLIFIASFVVMIIGVSQMGWWFTEMTAVFLVGAIAIGVIARLNEQKFVAAFTRGAADLLGVAFIIGIARGIYILMSDGLISDSVLFYASQFTEGMNEGVFINSLFLIFNGLSFFIPSSSGMAVLTMPIMAPLADTFGMGRELIVNAYQYGMGLFAFVNPTGLILASLGIVQIGYNKWLKFVWPLVLILMVVCFIMLSVTAFVG